ncbi:MAG: hypothetical protein ACI9WU_000765, partial [Myxococcota bacterium]
MTETVDAWREAEAPSWVMGLVVFAVLVLPGGIPLTIFGLPVYVRRRA